jgi:hypothetical protein
VIRHGSRLDFMLEALAGVPIPETFSGRNLTAETALPII